MKFLKLVLARFILMILFVEVLTSTATAQYFKTWPSYNEAAGDEQLEATLSPPPLTTTPIWQSIEQSVYSTGMIWRDADNDGLIDLFISNGNDIVRAKNYIYYHQQGGLETSASWQSANLEYSGHCAVGDIDDNGFPDFVVSNYLGAGGFGDPNRLNMYLNNAGHPNISPDWYTTAYFYSFSCAMGDSDMDGDLDLAVATGDAYNAVYTADLIYINSGGVLQTAPSWQSSDVTGALDITWGDVDNDGDLDLAVGSDDDGVTIHYNNSGLVEALPSWQGLPIEPVNTIIFGDINGDGWLDLIAAFNNQLGGGGYFRVYTNNGTGQLGASSTWQSSNGGYGSALALYDYDNDGDLDLAAGRWWDRPRVYENIGGTLTVAPVWQADVATVVEELAWVDIDGDGVEKLSTSLNGNGVKKLFYLANTPLYAIDSVYNGTTRLAYDEYCYDLVSGWISCETAPADSLVVYYRYSYKSDLAVANWDTYNMVYGNTSEPQVDFYADTVYGWAPFEVDFTDSSLGATAWLWKFGDGDSSVFQNPTHIYQQAGFFNVSLEALKPDGIHTREAVKMITVLADSLKGDTVALSDSLPVVMDIYVRNNFPVAQFNISVEFDGALPLMIDSVSKVGCRTEYFDILSYTHFDGFNKRLTFRLKNADDNSQPELAAGEGAVARLYFTLAAPFQPGLETEIRLDGYTSYVTYCFGSQLNYQPWIAAGLVSTNGSCCVEIRGNIDGSIDGQIDIADLLFMVDYQFGNPAGPEPPCPEEGDVNASGGIDIADLLYMVDYQFGNPAGPEPEACP